MKICLIGILAAVCSACASVPQVSDGKMTRDAIRAELERRPLMFSFDEELQNTAVPFRGQLGLEAEAEQQGGMAYPAAGVASMLAAVLTHAAIASSMDNYQKSAEQKQADKVLDEFQAAIDRVGYMDLLNHAMTVSELNLTPSPASDSIQPWILTAYPAYVISQDKKTVILENMIVLSEHGSAEPLYRKKINVIHNVRSAEGGISPDSLALVASEAFAESLRIFHRYIDDEADISPAETFRYKQGDRVRYERGRMVFADEKRVTIMSLRDELLSFPK